VTTTFANGSVACLTEEVTASVTIGNYNENIKFLVAPIGRRALLGTPWFTHVRGDIALGNGTFRFFAQDGWHSFPLTAKPGTNVGYIASEILGKQTKAPLTPTATARQEDNLLAFPAEVRPVIRRNAAVFDPPTQLPPKRPEDMVIREKPGAQPPKTRGLRRMGGGELELLKETLSQLLARGQIRRSTSPYGAPTMFTEKADGTKRLVVDYRALNEQTVRNSCPIPRIADLMAQVRGAQFFSKIDFRDGYHNIRMSPPSIEKTAFKTPFGLYEYTVMPFGLTNAPAVFAGMMSRIFMDMHGVNVIVYLDDVVVYGDTLAEHNTALEEVFRRLQAHQFKVKLSKCEFLAKEVLFCGHMISGAGIRTAQEKLDKINAPRSFPNKKAVEKFFGLAVWFQDYIANFAHIAQPLTHLLKQSTPFEWGTAQAEAVETLTKAINAAPVLRHFEADRETKVYSDASLYAIGGWVAQLHDDGWHPVGFASRKLSAPETRYSNPERELLALFYVLEKYGHYLRGGIPLEVNVDCSSLTQLQKMEPFNFRVSRWFSTLKDYNMHTIKHVQGKSNVVADYLTRNDEVMPMCPSCRKNIRSCTAYTVEGSGPACCTATVAQVSVSESPEEVERYKTAIGKDKLIKAILEWQSTGGNHPKASLFRTFRKEGHKWFATNRVYIPEDEPLRLEILAKFHDTTTAGHPGVKRTREQVSGRYFWPGLTADVRKYVRSCMVCQRNADRNALLEGELHPLPIPDKRFSDISIDFASLPKSKTGFDTVMVIVDRLTKLVRLLPGSSTDTTENIARRFLDGWYCAGFGLPRSIVSDRDSKFEAALWQELGKQLDIAIELSTARHQQTDGQAEIAIRTMKNTLRKVMGQQGGDWVPHLREVEFCLNNATSASTGYTPFYLAWGFQPRILPSDYQLTDQDGGEAYSLLHRINQTVEAGREAIRRAQEAQQRQYNKRRRPGPKYEVGGVAFLSRQGINWPAHATLPPIAQNKFLGPFTITDIDEARENITLELPKDMRQGRLHNTFHVSKLKKSVNRQDLFPEWKDPFERPGPVDGGDRYEVDRILDRRTHRRQRQYLVGFKGYPDSHNEWQTLDPSKPEDWKDEWHLLQAYDPSVEALKPPTPPNRTKRRRKR